MKQNIHICTIGWEKPDRVIKSILGHKSPSKVYLIYGKPGGMDKNGKAEQIALEIKAKLNEIYLPIPIELRKVDNPHNPDEIWFILQDIVENEKREDVEICLNVSAGTKVMVVASIMFTVLNEDADICIYYGIPESYPISEDENTYTSEGCKEIVEIPRLTPSLQRLFLTEDRTSPKILKALTNKEYNSIKELAEDIDIPRSTLKYHLDTLEQQKFVNITRFGKESKINITDMGRTYARILAK